MIFAPRSCPSRPGLAITTRILWAIGAAVYGGAPDRRGLHPGVAEPRRRPVRATSSRAPAACSSTAARASSPSCACARAAGRRSTRSSSRTGTSTTGATSSPGCGAACSGSGRTSRRPELWVPPGGIDLLAMFGEQFGTPTMFCEHVRRSRVRRGRAVRDRGRTDADARSGSRTTRSDVRLPGHGRRADARVLGRLGAERRARRGRPRTPTSSSARRRSSTSDADAAAARTPLGGRGGRRLQRLGRHAPAAHAPAAGARRSPTGLELAHDGLELEL